MTRTDLTARIEEVDGVLVAVGMIVALWIAVVIIRWARDRAAARAPEIRRHRMHDLRVRYGRPGPGRRRV